MYNTSNSINRRLLKTIKFNQALEETGFNNKSTRVQSIHEESNTYLDSISDLFSYKDLNTVNNTNNNKKRSNNNNNENSNKYQKNDLITVENKKKTSAFLKIDINMKQGISETFNSYIDQFMTKYYKDTKMNKNYIICNITTHAKLIECNEFVTLQEDSNYINLPVHLDQCNLPLYHHLLCPQDYFKVNNSKTEHLEWIFIPVQLPTDKNRIALITIHIKQKFISYWCPFWNTKPSYTIDMIHKLNGMNNGYLCEVVIWHTQYDNNGNNNEWYIILAIFEHIRPNSKNVWLSVSDSKKLPDSHLLEWYDKEVLIHNLNSKTAKKQSNDLNEISDLNKAIIELIEEENIIITTV